MDELNVDRGDREAKPSRAETPGDPKKAPLGFAPPALPKGGGAIRGIGETFSTSPSTGTASLRVPIATPGARGGFALDLGLAYDSGAGNGVFGIGWHVSVPAITRKTDKGLPRYLDADESDVFVLSGAEDLVPMRRAGAIDHVDRDGFRIVRYRPRVEGAFARIERWTELASGEMHWRATTRDNVTSIYGARPETRISDPAQPWRVFSWLLEETRDDRGNLARYAYRQEDGAGVDPGRASERCRFAGTRFLATAQRYLKRIEYGNRRPHDASNWLFEVVFDYGEHDHLAPTPDDDAPWALRPDAFSSYRAGFEIRTYRLCERVLVFHRFAELGEDACLVRSLDIRYEPDGAVTYLRAIEQAGYKRVGTGYLRSPLPALELDYTRAKIHDAVKLVDDDSLHGLYRDASGAVQWVDLDGEGIPGALASSPGGWHFKANLGGGRLAPPRALPTVPAATAPGGGAQLLDLGGDGCLDLVRYAPPVPGYFARTPAGDWEEFATFRSVPRIDWTDPDLRFVDLDGDGFADILIALDDALVWYPSRAREGFGAPIRLAKSVDEEQGPAVIFADGSETVQLADMSGDGLVDIVRVANGEVCYWPNLGHGKFGPKVTFDRSPWFDSADQFDPRRVRLVDVDGSGTSDLVYLGRDGVAIYRNDSGNELAAPHVIRTLPLADTMASTTVVDLLGTGTACLVWSSSAPHAAHRAVAYIDLMGGVKPHLLRTFANGLGAESTITYAPSTKFYLADKAAGRPWITRLAFPVHVVERTEVRDRISGNRFVMRRAYHHGYFDGVERELYGFAMTEQWDTEEIGVLGDREGSHFDATSHVPPVHTKTWFHTGALGDGRAISRQLAAEYFREPGITDAAFSAQLLEDTVLDPTWTAEEQREACRVLRGAVLRQEVYALDDGELAAYPYSVAESNHHVVRLHAHDGGRHAVFLSHSRETVTYHYERRAHDPRIQHALTLAVDDFGNVLASAAVVYGRRVADPTLTADEQAEQARTHIVYTENAFTNAIITDEVHRTPRPSETVTYEITGLLPAAARFSFAELRDGARAATFVEFEQVAGVGPHRRRIEHVRTIYRRDDLTGPLALHVLEARALPFETRSLALTPGLVSAVYAEMTDAMLASAGYVFEDGLWWATSGRSFYSPDRADSAAQELARAKAHFFLPRRHEDPFGNATMIRHDDYDLLPLEARDAAGNLVTAGIRDEAGVLVSSELDYRVLQPRIVMDPNRNRIGVAYDALGLVVGTARMGKPEETLGDTLDGFDEDLPAEVIEAHVRDPLADPLALVGRAGTRIVYDLLAYQRTRDDAQPRPAVAYTITREVHHGDPGGATSRVQHSLSYSDGFGRVIQTKQPAERESAAAPARWVGSGWTVFNNKGKPVRRYEPFFTAAHDFEVRAEGVAPTLFYDPLDRVVATLHPDHTFEKVTFDAWRQATYDANDNVLVADPALDEHVGGWFARLARADYMPTWHATYSGGTPEQRDAAEKAAVHRRTETTAHFDTLGRAFLTVAKNRLERPDGTAEESALKTRTFFDIENNPVDVVDPLGRSVARYTYDVLGRRIRQRSMEAGDRVVLPDVAGVPIYAWDSRGHRFHTEFDGLRRPTRFRVRGALADEPTREILYEQIEYGEDQTADVNLNLRGRVFRRSDGAGTVTCERYDFKGNSLAQRRALAEVYDEPLDWSRTVRLELHEYTSSTSYDALDRPFEHTLPDQTRVRPIYNEAALLERVEANLEGAATVTKFVDGISYNARGQRLTVELHNGAATTTDYDPQTFRVTRIRTAIGDAADAHQDLHYTYDPVGNVTRLRDDAQQTIYFRNRRVDPTADYTYDALYRLIAASGREHLGLGAEPTPSSPTDAPRAGVLHRNDGNAVGRYLEQYLYDAVGNITQLIHAGTDPSSPGWTRNYHYRERSQLEPATQTTNRLTSTQTGDDVERAYTHDDHGNMTSMPHLWLMRWDCRDRLAASSQQVVTDGSTPETTYYVYDASGQRVRKVTERHAEPGKPPTRKSERIYLGGFEIYREYAPDGDVTLARSTIHVMDDRKRIALVEIRTDGMDRSPKTLIRYQLDNHLGSACLELDENAAVITYEEYTPYGSTAYQGVRDQAETPKRYRYSGKERDEETGLLYCEQRYGVPWLGRWTSCDPLRRGQNNLFDYLACNPVRFIDPDGRAETDANWSLKLQTNFGRLGGPKLGPMGTPVSLGLRLGSNAKSDFRATAEGTVFSNLSHYRFGASYQHQTHNASLSFATNKEFGLGPANVKNVGAGLAFRSALSDSDHLRLSYAVVARLDVPVPNYPPPGRMDLEAAVSGHISLGKDLTAKGEFAGRVGLTIPVAEVRFEGKFSARLESANLQLKFPNPSVQLDVKFQARVDVKGHARVFGIPTTGFRANATATNGAFDRAHVVLGGIFIFPGIGASALDSPHPNAERNALASHPSAEPFKFGQFVGLGIEHIYSSKNLSVTTTLGVGVGLSDKNVPQPGQNALTISGEFNLPGRWR